MPTTVQKRPYVLAERSEAILQSFALCPLMTADQIVRLLELKPTIRSNWYKHLKNLTDAGYLELIDWLPPRGRTGAHIGVWSVGRMGRTYFEQQGLPYLPDRRDNNSRDAYFLRHTMAINEALIDLKLFCDRSLDWDLVDARHDAFLKRDMMKVKIPVPIKRTRHIAISADTYQRVERIEHEQVYVVPDAFTRLLHRNGTTSPALWWEVDLSGSEKEDVWKEKVVAIITFYETGLYVEEFKTPNLTVAVPVHQGDRRLEKLLAWTEQVLTKQEKQGWGKNFRFTTETPGKDPEGFLLGNHWVKPFSREYVPLVDQPDS